MRDEMAAIFSELRAKIRICTQPLWQRDYERRIRVFEFANGSVTYEVHSIAYSSRQYSPFASARTQTVIAEQKDERVFEFVF